MDNESAKILVQAIEQAWQRRPAAAVFNSMDMASSVMRGIALADAEQAATIRDQLALESIAGTIERRIVRALEKSDSRQGWLALPEFQHVPHFIKVEGGLLDINEATLEQYRETKEEIRARIKAYAYPRRSAENLKRDKQTLAEMSKRDRQVAPLMAGDPEMKMREGVHAFEGLGGHRIKARRERATKGAHAPNTRRKNQ